LSFAPGNFCQKSPAKKRNLLFGSLPQRLQAAQNAGSMRNALEFQSRPKFSIACQQTMQFGIGKSLSNNRHDCQKQEGQVRKIRLSATPGGYVRRRLIAKFDRFD
jgi:hypothetical protein